MMMTRMRSSAAVQRGAPASHRRAVAAARPCRSRLVVSVRLSLFSKFPNQRRKPDAAGPTTLNRAESSGPSVLSPPSQDQTEDSQKEEPEVQVQGVHHVALLCENLERSLEFYQGILGLEVNPDRPDKKLPYRGAWLWLGKEMLHLMELPNPDPMERPAHGGRDRHFCVTLENLDPLMQKLTDAGIEFTKSMSGRPAVFFRDPDMNCLECLQPGE